MMQGSGERRRPPTRMGGGRLGLPECARGLTPAPPPRHSPWRSLSRLRTPRPLAAPRLPLAALAPSPPSPLASPRCPPSSARRACALASGVSLYCCIPLPLALPCITRFLAPSLFISPPAVCLRAAPPPLPLPMPMPMRPRRPPTVDVPRARPCVGACYGRWPRASARLATAAGTAWWRRWSQRRRPRPCG